MSSRVISMSDGWVYFIGCAELGAIKIGYSAFAPSRRLSSLQIGCPGQLLLLDQIAGSPELETRFHRAFAALRIRGEWFRHDGKLRDFLYYLDREPGETLSARRLSNAVADVLDCDCLPHPADPMPKEEYAASGDWHPLADLVLA